MYKVYAIKSLIKNYIYVGMTNNIERRLKQHNNGSTKSTKAYGPYYLNYEESCKDRITARKREKYLKSGVGKEFLR